MQKTYKIPYKLDDGDSYYLISMNKIMNGHINLRVKAKHLFFGWLDKNTDIKNVKFDLPIKVNYTLHPDVNVL